MRALRWIVRSWPLLVCGGLGIGAAAALYVWSGLLPGATAAKVLAIGLGVVSAGILAASLFDTRRDRWVIALGGLLLGAAFLLALRDFLVVPWSDGRQEATRAWSEYLRSAGSELPDLTLQDLEEQPVRLTDLRGSWVLLDVWHPDDVGVDERIALRRLAHEELADEGLIVLGLSSAPAERQRDIRRSLRIPYRLLLDDGQLRESLALPLAGAASLLIDRDGTIHSVALEGLFGLHRLARAVRGADWDALRRPIAGPPASEP